MFFGLASIYKAHIGRAKSNHVTYLIEPRFVAFVHRNVNLKSILYPAVIAVPIHGTCLRSAGRKEKICVRSK